jgi:hypothetical protein
MSMISQADGPASVVAEGSTNPAQLAISPVEAGEPTDGTTKAIEPAPPARPPEPMSVRGASARALAAHVARRSRLAEQIKAEHPHYSKAEIEERLEQFGA